jgi:DNA invertase Pin-like site-specific DNA recombinase
MLQGGQLSEIKFRQRVQGTSQPRELPGRPPQLLPYRTQHGAHPRRLGRRHAAQPDEPTWFVDDRQQAPDGFIGRKLAGRAAWFLIDDLSRMSRNTIESLRLGELAEATGVRVVGASDGYDSANPQSSLLLPVLGSMNEAFITQLRSKVKRGMDDAFRRGDNVSPPGVGYRLVDVKDANGNLVITHKGTIEKRVEIDPEAAAWIVRGAEMIAREGKSPIELARLFNEQKVGGRQTWSDNMIRKLYSRERLVGREVFRTTRQEKNRHTGKVRYVKLPQDQWLVRESPHLRILPDELADAVRAKLNLAAQSFGRTAKDRTKKAHRADLYPKVLAKAEEMGRQLAAKREQLKELLRAGRRPKVKSVKEKDVVAALGKLRDLLQGDVGVAAQVLRALVGDVVIQKQHVDGYENPQMVARFTINAVPALAVLDRGGPTDRDGAPVPVWDSIHASPNPGAATTAGPAEAIVPLIYDRRAAARKAAKKRDGTA